MPELLESAEPAEARRNLDDLRKINRWFGGHRVVRSLVGEAAAGAQTFSLLDVGAASGDTAAVVKRRYPRASVVSADIRPLHLESAPHPKLAADAFALPFQPRTFDFVLCSLFLHHFDDDTIVSLLAAFAATARRAVLVSDLERHPLAYYFLPATRSILRWNELTVRDGAVSVQAGFRPLELERLARAAGLHPRVRRHRPWFRLSLIAPVK
ncbi:MAG: methyltransferase domain-containing protein [Bryobacteraceae bacterium]|nr:methyltransferase domain-containing protein [Bryobacteraceae bacterium]